MQRVLLIDVKHVLIVGSLSSLSSSLPFWSIGTMLIWSLLKLTTLHPHKTKESSKPTNTAYCQKATWPWPKQESPQTQLIHEGPIASSPAVLAMSSSQELRQGFDSHTRTMQARLEVSLLPLLP